MVSETERGSGLGGSFGSRSTSPRSGGRFSRSARRRRGPGYRGSACRSAGVGRTTPGGGRWGRRRSRGEGSRRDLNRRQAFAGSATGSGRFSQCPDRSAGSVGSPANRGPQWQLVRLGHDHRRTQRRGPDPHLRPYLPRVQGQRADRGRRVRRVRAASGAAARSMRSWTSSSHFLAVSESICSTSAPAPACHIAASATGRPARR